MICLIVAKKTAPKHKGGAPEKVPGGLRRGLYVRVNADLMGKLDRLTEARSLEAGVTLSKADVARGLIGKAMEAQITDGMRREKLGKMDDVDRMEEAWSQSLMRDHITDYFMASSVRRLDVLREIQRAEKENRDLISDDLPCGEWRHKWPPGLRKAIVALWSTPKP
jgi:hypothetical protein